MFWDGMNSKDSMEHESVKKQCTQNQQHIVDIIPKLDTKQGRKKTEHQKVKKY